MDSFRIGKMLVYRITTSGSIVLQAETKDQRNNNSIHLR